MSLLNLCAYLIDLRIISIKHKINFIFKSSKIASTFQISDNVVSRECLLGDISTLKFECGLVHMCTYNKQLNFLSLFVGQVILSVQIF